MKAIPAPRDCMVGSHCVHTSATRFFEERALKPKPITSSSRFNHSCCSPGLRGPACLPFLVQHLPLHSHTASLSGPLSLPLSPGFTQAWPICVPTWRANAPGEYLFFRVPSFFFREAIPVLPSHEKSLLSHHSYKNYRFMCNYVMVLFPN